jgi:hypothetical protein
MVWRDDTVQHVGHCKHLRFTWFSGYPCGEPQFFNGWHSEHFQHECESKFECYINTNPHLRDREIFPVIRTVDCLRTVLRKVNSSDVDEVWEYEFWDGGSNVVGETVAVFWGIKIDRTK